MDDLLFHAGIVIITFYTIGFIVTLFNFLKGLRK